jgi:hypothetical protein
MDLNSSLEALKVPREFDWYEEDKGDELREQLARWKDRAFQALRHLAETPRASTSSQDSAHIIFLVVSFVCTENWSSLTHQEVALGNVTSTRPDSQNQPQPGPQNTSTANTHSSLL